MDNSLFKLYKEAVERGDSKAESRIGSQIVKENLPLIRKLLVRLRRRTNSPNEWADIMQAGCIGLLRALRKFDPERGAFSTYVAHWIRDEFQQEVLTEQPIYRPKNTGMPYQLHRLAERIEVQQGRKATAEDLGVTQDQLEEWASLPSVVALEKSASGLRRGRSPVVGASTQDRVVNLHDVVPSDDPPTNETYADAEEVRRVHDALWVLTDRERRITLGFLDGKTYKEIAATEGVSEETVRDDRNKAIAKLKDFFAEWDDA